MTEHSTTARDLPLSLSLSLSLTLSLSRDSQKDIEEAYEAQWDSGKGSHHPDYKPDARGKDVHKASRETEELLLALIKNDVKLVYKKIEEGADVNFEFGRAYGSKEGYTPLMCACHRGRLEATKATIIATSNLIVFT